MKNCFQQQDKSYRYARRLSLSDQIRWHCKIMIASGTNCIVTRSRFNAPMCKMLLSGQIRLYCKKLTASWTKRTFMHKYVTVAPMLLCVMSYCQDKSDRIGIETCNVFHCAAVSSSDVFETAVLILRTKNDWRESLGAILQ